MEGPIDPQHPGQDAGAPQPEAQDDLHALLERLLGQGDVRPSAPGAGDDLWPDPFAATADEVSTIVPAPETPTAVADPPAAAADVAPPARAWEPVVVDASSTTTNVDDIHAAILASVSVELQPIAPPALTEPAAAEPVAAETLIAEALAAEPPADDAAAAALAIDTTSWEPAPTEAMPGEDAAVDASESAAAAWYAIIEADSPAEPFAAGDDLFEPAATEALPVDARAGEPAWIAPAIEDALVVETPAVEATPVVEATPAVEEVSAVEEVPVAAAEEAEATPFVLTPFEAPAADADAAVDAPADGDGHPDAEALWAAAVPELGLEVAPLLELEPVDIAQAEEPLELTGVVLPWPTQEPKADAAPAAHDLIEAALAGLQHDLTAEPVEPLRTPDVAASTAHVVFRLGARVMAVPLSAVSEIARPPKVTRLPHVPAWVLGIANLRGDIVSMLDLEGFFSGKAGKSSHEQRMLALRPAGDEVRTAVLVDSVDGIKAFEDARVARVTRGYDAEVAPYARGLYQLEDDLVVLIDADRLLQSKPMRQFEDGAGAR
jgi:chemotaxis signal transduction protein